MSYKSIIITISTVVGLAILVILLNYVSSEFFSFKHGNFVKKVYLKNTLVKAEVVESPKKIEQGLAGRETLAEGRGMLFVMPENDFQRFWMRGMQFPIDIIWIASDRVIGCEKNVSPKDERIFTSPGKASLVLEVSSGFCDRYFVEINDPIKI